MPPSRRARSAITIGFLLATAMPAGSIYLAADALAQTAAGGRQTYSSPGGSLDDALNRFSRAAGITLSFDPALVRGKTAPALNGGYSVPEALSALLRPNGLDAVRAPNGTYSLRPLPPAPAPVDGAATTLPPLDVTGRYGRETAYGPVAGYVATRTATATKTDASILEVPQAISVVTADQIRAQGSQRIEHALTYTPGVTVGSYGSNPEQDYVFVRGFHAPLYFDGVRQYRDYVTGAQVGIEPYGLERVEVLRGPSSVLYGQIAPGGMVNMVTKRPTDEPLREIELQVGNFDRRQAAFDVSDRVTADGRVLFRVTGLARQADGQMDFQGDDRMYIAPSLTFKPWDSTTLTLLAHIHHDDDALRPVPLPAQGTLLPNPNGRIPTSRFLGEPGFDSYKRRQYMIGYEFDHRFNDTWSFRQNLRYTRVKQHEDYTLTMFDGSFLTDFRTVDRAAWDDRNRLNTVAVDNQLNAKLQTGALSHSVLVGADYRRATNAWWFAGSYTMSPIDAYNPQYGGSTGTLTPAIDQFQRESQVGLYLQDQIRFERWLLTLGGRYDWASGRTEDRFSAPTFVTAQKDDAGTWRAGLTYLFDNGLAPYASYSTSFEPETGLNSSGQAFKPTTGRQFEIGVKYQPAGHNSFIAASVFDLTRENVTTRDPNPPPTNPFGQIQTGEMRNRGFELEGKASLGFGLDLTAAYTYFDSEITKSENGDEGMPFFFTPKHQVALWADYTQPSGPLGGLGGGAGMRYRSAVYGLGHEVKVPGYTLFDAALHYDLGRLDARLDGARLQLNARNLFDKEYVSNCSFFEGCYYGDRRTVIATLRYRW